MGGGEDLEGGGPAGGGAQPAEAALKRPQLPPIPWRRLAARHSTTSAAPVRLFLETTWTTTGIGRTLVRQSGNWDLRPSEGVADLEHGLELDVAELDLGLDGEP